MERVSFHRLAHREVSEAGEFYQLESPGLGVSEVEACIRVILQYPQAGQLIARGIRH